MLHLYVILTVLGTPQMTMRWANDEMASCWEAQAKIDAGLDKTLAEDQPDLIELRKEWPGLRRADVVYTCEMHTPESLPKLKNPVRMKLDDHNLVK